MILTTFNQSKHQIRMLSIPRDTISYIPKVGYYDKITHAHAYGGPIAAMDSVEATMNVPVVLLCESQYESICRGCK